MVRRSRSPSDQWISGTGLPWSSVTSGFSVTRFSARGGCPQSPPIAMRLPYTSRISSASASPQAASLSVESATFTGDGPA